MVGCRVTLKRDRKLVSLSLNAMFKLQIPMLFSCSRGESPPSHSKLQDEIISSVVEGSPQELARTKAPKCKALLESGRHRPLGLHTLESAKEGTCSQE